MTDGKVSVDRLTHETYRGVHKGTRITVAEWLVENTSRTAQVTPMLVYGPTVEQCKYR